MAQNSNAFVQTFEKGLQILEYLVEEKTVSVTGVAKRMGIQKSASYRFLNTLRLHGYVDKDQHNSYRLTDRLSKLGKGMVPKREFYNIVAQFLDNLAKKNKENNGICNLGMWNGKEIVYMVQSANDKYMLLTVGSTVPAYCSALGKAVLAYLPDEALENYIQRTEFVTFTESTVNSAERLRADLQAVREKGYALMDDELYPGLKGLAMPVINGSAPDHLRSRGPAGGANAQAPAGNSAGHRGLHGDPCRPIAHCTYFKGELSRACPLRDQSRSAPRAGPLRRSGFSALRSLFFPAGPRKRQ